MQPPACRATNAELVYAASICWFMRIRAQVFQRTWDVDSLLVGRILSSNFPRSLDLKLHAFVLEKEKGLKIC